MKSYVSRTIELKNVFWLTNKKVPTLETIVRDIWVKRKFTNERTVQRDDGSSVQGLRMIDYRNSGHRQKCVAVHCGRYTDRQPIGIVSKDAKSISTIGSKPPADNENFLEQDFVAIIKANSVILTSAANNRLAFMDFLKVMIAECQMMEHYAMFDLISVADGNKLQLIKQFGVKNLRIDMTISDVVMSQVDDVDSEEKKAFGIPAMFFSIANALAKKDKSLADYAKDSESKVEVCIKVKTGETKSVRDGVNSLARRIVSSSDGNNYAIELNNKQKLSLDSIKFRKTINLQPMSSTFSVDDAISKMLIFFDELEADGHI